MSIAHFLESKHWYSAFYLLTFLELHNGLQFRIFRWGVCKTRTGYLRMADADRIKADGKNADNKKSKRKKTRNADGKTKLNK